MDLVVIAIAAAVIVSLLSRIERPTYQDEEPMRLIEELEASSPYARAKRAIDAAERKRLSNE